MAAVSRCVSLALLPALLMLLILPGACPVPVGTQDPANGLPREEGTQWAVLVAGSSEYANYRHQADVCHAYQVLHKGGLKDENIVVFMYDDIANNNENPRSGIIINSPEGQDVYAGVPKDYTGEQVSAANLYAVLLGNKRGVKGGSGKVLHSGPNDRIFIYYSDHGGPGVLGMPSTPYVYAADFVKVLKKMHTSRSYKEMVIYIEACNSGSIFEGLLPSNLNIYATTASKPEEDSYGTYCPGTYHPPPPEYDTCLGDGYSVSWMEDSDSQNRQKETVQKQYEVVKKRTYESSKEDGGSHVMEYGDKSINSNKLYMFQGFDPSAVDVSDAATPPSGTTMGAVNQRDADLLFLWRRYEKLNATSKEKTKIRKEIVETVTHRKHLDNSIDLIGKLTFGTEHGPSILQAVRPSGQALVDDWDCLKSMVKVFESHCGSLTQYGMKHMRAFANICNRGVAMDSMEEACMSACHGYNSTKWSPLNKGYSA